LKRFDKYTIQTLGFALIVMGIFPLFFGLRGNSTSCPATGCPDSVISRLCWQSAISFFSGITLVTVGIVLVIMTRRMKPAQGLTLLSNEARNQEIYNYAFLEGLPINRKRYTALNALDIACNPDIRGVWRRALILGLDLLRSQALPLTNRKEKVSERRYRIMEVKLSWLNSLSTLRLQNT